MANLPIKLLKDGDQNPFIPFVPANAVLLNGSTHSCEEEFANRYTKPEVDAKFAALGTIMEFKGTVPTVEDLPTTATNGDVYLVGTDDLVAFIYIDGEWEDLGKMVDLSAYSTTTEVQSLINSAIATERDNTTVAINSAMNNAVALAKDYTDDEILTRQPMLESGVNIKTINGTTLLGSGNLEIEEGDVVGPSSSVDKTLAVFDGTSGKLIKNIPSIEYHNDFREDYLGIGGVAIGDISWWDSGLCLSYKTVANLDKPKQPKHAATKEYVDDILSGYTIVKNGTDGVGIINFKTE